MTDETSVEFRPAKGGLVSETRMAEKGDKFGPSFKRETGIHPSIGHAKRHLDMLFGKNVGAGKKKSDSIKK